MYMNHVGNSITIAFDSQEEADALLRTLAGSQQPNANADAFGKNMYSFFYAAVYKLATNFAAETKGMNIQFPRSDQRSHPYKGYRGSL
jgi:hypothetical protein